MISYMGGKNQSANHKLNIGSS